MSQYELTKEMPSFFFFVDAPNLEIAQRPLGGVQTPLRDLSKVGKLMEPLKIILFLTFGANKQTTTKQCLI